MRRWIWRACRGYPFPTPPPSLIYWRLGLGRDNREGYNQISLFWYEEIMFLDLSRILKDLTCIYLMGLRVDPLMGCIAYMKVDDRKSYSLVNTPMPRFMSIHSLEGRHANSGMHC